MTVRQQVGQWILPRLPVTRFTFDLLRTELQAWRVTICNRVWWPRRRRLQRLRGMRNLLINVACGPHPLDRFVNLDLNPVRPEVVGWDCRWTLPFESDSARGVRIEHFAEHLEPREELPSLLLDCHRILAGGGVLRVVVPDAARFLMAYCRPDRHGFDELAVPDPFPTDLPSRMDVVNHIFHQWHEHRWAYDFENMADRLQRAGFARIEKMTFQRSLMPELACDAPNHAPYSLYVDAVKAARSLD